MATLKNHSILLATFCGLALFSCNSPAPESGAALTTSLQNVSEKCDNPDADIECCFLNMPVSLSSVMDICGPEEPGERLILTGRVFKADGKTPFPDVIIYAYHTDNKGFYSKSGQETGVQRWHGRLHGWCRTDSEGHYEIHTIRPASYPNSDAPAHIHSAIKKPDGSMPFYISDFVFRDDPFVSEMEISRGRYPGGSGIVDVVKSPEGVWTGNRDLVLP